MTHAAPKMSHPWRRASFKRNMKAVKLRAEKPKRRVFVMIEMETEVPLATLKKLNWVAEQVKVLQVQANVVVGSK